MRLAAQESGHAMRQERNRIVVEIALTIALAAVLNLPWFRIRLPINIAGGTISLNMLPLFVLALRRGLTPGLLAGALYGVLDLVLDPFVVHPVQVILDYPLAYALCGLAGLGSNLWHRVIAQGPTIRAEWVAFPYVILGGLGRLSAHWLSGLVFFGQNAPAGQPIWLYSLLYNLSYLVPSIVMSVLAALALLPVLERAVPSTPPRSLVHSS